MAQKKGCVWWDAERYIACWDVVPVRSPEVRAAGTGGLEDWRTGGLEDWRTGGLEDWRTGGLEDWRTGLHGSSPYVWIIRTSRSDLWGKKAQKWHNQAGSLQTTVNTGSILSPRCNSCWNKSNNNLHFVTYGLRSSPDRHSTCPLQRKMLRPRIWSFIRLGGFKYRVRV